jgi:hypothetical protein
MTRIGSFWRALVQWVPAGAFAAAPPGLTDLSHSGGVGTPVAIAFVHAIGIAALVAMYFYFRRSDPGDERDEPGDERDDPGPRPDRPRLAATRYMPEEIRAFVPPGAGSSSERREREPVG